MYLYRKFLIYSFVLISFSCSAFSSQKPHEKTIEIGVAAHLWGLNHSQIDRKLRMAASINAKLIRWDAPWKAVEKDKGHLQIPSNWDYIVDQAAKLGIESLLILDYGNKNYDAGGKPISKDAIDGFAKYSEFVAQYFKGRVRKYEIWNEWNGKAGNTLPGKPEEYIELLKSVYPRMKSVDSNLFILAGSFSASSYESILVSKGLLPSGMRNKSSAFENFLAGNGQGYLDGIAIHPYNVYESKLWGYDRYRRQLKYVVDSIRLTPAYKDIPIYITETGWPTSNTKKFGVSEDDQFEFSRSAILDACNLGIENVILYELIDGASDKEDPEGNFGLYGFDDSPKKIASHLIAKKATGENFSCGK